MNTRNPIESLLERIDRGLANDLLWLPVLFVVAFLLKLVYILQSANALSVIVPIMDSEYYLRTAREISAGSIVRNDAFFMGPLYSYVLAGIFSVIGKSLTTVRLVQIAAGSATVLLVYLLGRRTFRPSVAFLAAILLIFYGAMTFYEGQFLMSWLGTLINMALLYHLYRTRERAGLGKHVVSGVLIGLSALARANILLFAAVPLAWILFLSGEKRRWLCAGVLTAAMIATIAPATIHNFVAARDFVPITSNGGVNFYIGNCEGATGIYSPPKGINIVTDESIKKYVERQMGRPLKPSELSRYWFRESFDFIRAHPGSEAALLLRKTALFFNGYEVPQIEAYGVARERHATLRVLFVNFWMILSLASLGLIYLAKQWRKYFFLYGYVLTFSLSIIVFFVTARYRVQIAPVLCLFAAYTLLVIVPRMLSRPAKHIAPAALFVAIVLFTRPSLFALPAEDVVWREHTHEARRYSQTGRYEEAIAEINKAIEIHPDYAESYIHRAVINKEHAKLFQAISDYSKAVELDPNLPTVHYDLAQALRQTKMFEPAAESYLRAIELNPRMLEAYNNLGVTYRELRQYDEAIRYFEKVIEMDPGYTKAYNNLGASLAEVGEIDRSIEVLEAAIRVDPGYALSYKNLGVTYLHAQKPREAYRMLERYLALAPGDRQARETVEKLRSVLQGDSLRDGSVDSPGG